MAFKNKISQNRLKITSSNNEILYSYQTINMIKVFLNNILELTGLFKFVHSLIAKLFSKREKLSKQFIKGEGIEIGALHLPLKVLDAHITYVDRMSTKALRNEYPTLQKFIFKKVDVIDDGEYLRKIKNGSQDFVIANHFIEHSENPVAVLKNHLRVLKPNGIIYWAVPDKRYTFDNVRNLTTIEHINSDYKKGGKFSRKSHYDEWAEKVLALKDGNADQEANKLMNYRYSIHFHVWTSDSFLEFLQSVRKTYKFPFTVLTIKPNINEFIVILKKTH